MRGPGRSRNCRGESSALCSTSSSVLNPANMGNNTSSSGRGHHDETVDLGFLTPQGEFTGTPDWNQQIVAQLICERRLAPFYRPLEDYDESWEDERILASRKKRPEPDEGSSDGASMRSHETGSSHHSKPGHAHSRRPNPKEGTARYSEALVYKGAVECPICFLVSLVQSTNLL